MILDIGVYIFFNEAWPLCARYLENVPDSAASEALYTFREVLSQDFETKYQRQRAEDFSKILPEIKASERFRDT